MNQEYIERKLKWFDERPHLKKEKEDFLKSIETKTEKKKEAKVKDKLFKKIVLVVYDTDKEKEKQFLAVTPEKDISLEIIHYKEAIKRGYSINSFPSVVYVYKNEVVWSDYILEKQHILDTSQNVFKEKEKVAEDGDESVTHGDIIKDKNDQNQLNWGGERSTSRIKTSKFQSAPMFFRRNGMVADIVNLYQDQTVFLMCNGPSMKEIDLSLFKKPGIMTFGINNGGHLIRPNIWTCVDDPSRFMRSIWEDPTITKIVPQAHFEKRLYDKDQNGYLQKLVGDCPNVYGFRRNEKFASDEFFFEDTINWGNHKNYGGGRSVMISSLRICHLLGFKNVYIVGCDFDMAEDKKYFFNEERTKSSISNNNNSYAIMTKMFTQLKPIMTELNFNVFNVNPKSKLEVFDFVKLEDVIKQNEIDVTGDTYGMYESPKNKK